MVVQSVRIIECSIAATLQQHGMNSSQWPASFVPHLGDIWGSRAGQSYPNAYLDLIYGCFDWAAPDTASLIKSQTLSGISSQPQHTT